MIYFVKRSSKVRSSTSSVTSRLRNDPVALTPIKDKRARRLNYHPLVVGSRGMGQTIHHHLTQSAVYRILCSQGQHIIYRQFTHCRVDAYGTEAPLECSSCFLLCWLMTAPCVGHNEHKARRSNGWCTDDIRTGVLCRAYVINKMCVLITVHHSHKQQFAIWRWVFQVSKYFAILEKVNRHDTYATVCSINLRG